MTTRPDQTATPPPAGGADQAVTPPAAGGGGQAVTPPAAGRPDPGVVLLGAGTRLGPVAEIPPGEGRTYAVGGEMVAVFRLRDGSLRAVQAVCPHRGGPLADGQIDRKVLVCPLHLNTFDLTTGCSLSGQADLTVYPVAADEGGHIVIFPEVST